jgi:hypothetical protein
MTARARRRTAAVVTAFPLLAASLLCACAARPAALPAGYQQPTLSFFVAHAAGDDSHMEEGIAAELRARGLQASSGTFERMPPDTDVLVIYSDSWFANILVQGEILRLEARNARTGHTIASVEQRWISHIGDVPSALIADAVGQMLGVSSEAR